MFSVEPETELTLEVRGYHPCPKCGHEEVAIFLTPALPHYAKALCVNCGNFRTWVPNPDRDDRIRRQLADIESALGESWGSSWEFKFLGDIQEQLERKQGLTSKQKTCLDRVLSNFIPRAEREWLP